MGILNLYNPPYHFEFYVGVVLLNELFEQYLNVRQLSVIKSDFNNENNNTNTLKNSNDDAHTKTQRLLDVYLKANDYRKTLEYAYDKVVYQIVSSLIHTTLTLVLLFSKFGPLLWNYSKSLYPQKSEYVHSLLFCGFKLLFDTVFEVPFGLYSDFVLEQKHGFNKKTYGLFVKDLFLSLLIQLVIGAPALCAIIYLFHWGGDKFYVYIFAFVVVLNFIILVIYPELIAPLFNKYEPLKDQELKEKIEELAKRYDFPLTGIKEMDGSKRSSHSNMYFYGFWRFKKIVVYDTLLKLPHRQVIAVTSHELGHWKSCHFWKVISFPFLNLFAMFYLFKVFKDDYRMYESFGFDISSMTTFIIGITLFGYIYTPVGIIIHILFTTMSRKNEFEADDFGVKAGFGTDLIDALIEVHKENKSIIHHDPLYSWYHFTHPVLYERIYAMFKAIENHKI